MDEEKTDGGKLVSSFSCSPMTADIDNIKTYSGAVQGGIISPILANIYLDQFDKYMKEYKVGFEKGKKRAVLKSYARTVCTKPLPASTEPPNGKS